MIEKKDSEKIENRGIIIPEVLEKVYVIPEWAMTVANKSKIDLKQKISEFVCNLLECEYKKQVEDTCEEESSEKVNETSTTINAGENLGESLKVQN